MVLSGQTNSNELAEGRRSGSDVDRNIEHLTLQHANELRLRVLALLVMKAAHYTVLREGFVVLNKLSVDAEFKECLAVVCFAKIASGIFKETRFEYFDFRN